MKDPIMLLIRLISAFVGSRVVIILNWLNRETHNNNISQLKRHWVGYKWSVRIITQTYLLSACGRNRVTNFLILFLMGMDLLSVVASMCCVDVTSGKTQAIYFYFIFMISLICYHAAPLWSSSHPPMDYVDGMLWNGLLVWDLCNRKWHLYEILFLKIL